MLSLRNLLLPTDFSPRARGVVAYASALARHFQAKLTLLHVLPSRDLVWAGVGGSPGWEQALKSQRDLAREQLDSFLLSELTGLSVTRVLLEGDPANGIVQYAHAKDVSLIMMPTRGSGPFRRFLLGSVTAKVLHDANCPVWTAAPTQEAAAGRSFGVRTVVCAADVAPQSADPLRWAAEFASEFHARLIVVHVIPSLDFNPEACSIDAGRQERILTEARSNAARALKSCCPYEAEIRVESGSVSRVVSSTAEDERADLLVIGRASMPGIFGRLRTNSYAIIRESPCPVVSV